MIKEEYKEINPELLELAHGSAWSIESMDTHDAGGRGVTYIGSKTSGYLDNDSRNGKVIFDYYVDTAGVYWFKNRALLPSGEIVSMERYIFGREVTRKRGHNRKW